MQRLSHVQQVPRPVLWAAALLIVAGCRGPLIPQAIHQTRSAGVAATIGDPAAAQDATTAPHASGSPRAVVAGASPENIATIAVTVSGEDKYGTYQSNLGTATLTNVGGVWSATVEDLPIGPSLTFMVVARDTGGAEIYSGSSTQALGSSGAGVSVSLYPVDDGQPLAFPIVRSITRPGEIVRGGAAAVIVGLAGSPGETLDVSFQAGAGSFTPQDSAVSIPSSGGASLNASYQAPDSTGGATHRVTAQNGQGNSVTSEFTTTHVHSTGSAQLVVGFAPAVTAIATLRNGTEVSFTATVTDDGPQSAFSYAWSFVGPAAFSAGNANPGILSGYSQTVSGTVYLTVTDGDGLSTTLSFRLVAGQFPDTLVTEPQTPTYPPDDPGVPIVANGIYWVSLDDASIWRSNPDGSGAAAVLSGLYQPRRIVVDMENGKIYWTEGDGSTPGAGSVKRANSDGSNIQLIAGGLGSPTAVALDPVAHQIYYDADHALVRANLNGSDPTDVAVPPGGSGFSGVDVDPDSGYVYFTSPGNGVYRFHRDDPAGTLLLIAASPSAQGIAFDPSSDRVYWTDPGNTAGRVRAANADGTGIVSFAVTPASALPVGIDVDPYAGTVYWGDINGSIYTMTGAGASQVIVIADRASDLDVAIVSPPAPPGPDLRVVILGVLLDTSINMTRVDYTIYNDGQVGLDGTQVLYLDLIPNSATIPAMGTTQLDLGASRSGTYSTLAAGASQTSWQGTNFFSSTVPHGTAWLIVDSENRIAEADETNNIAGPFVW